jgi:hypothetical protein
MSKVWLAATPVGVALVLGIIVHLYRRAVTPRFPVIYNVANLLDEDALGQIEEVVRARGERFPISIAVVNADRAQVGVGDGGFESQSSRVYKMRRGASGWEIDTVESWKNGP